MSSIVSLATDKVMSVYSWPQSALESGSLSRSTDSTLSLRRSVMRTSMADMQQLLKTGTNCHKTLKTTSRRTPRIRR